jgi:hypothetical protein
MCSTAFTRISLTIEVPGLTVALSPEVEDNPWGRSIEKHVCRRNPLY